MKLPTLQGIIRRRLLVNFRVDPEVAQRQLPARFRPKLQAGYAVAGVCLIRLEHIRPKMFPALIGLSSENAAHRIAVEWTDDDREATREGVFIPRRDTDSTAGHLAGGRLFPGEQHKASFKVEDDGVRINFRMKSDDASVAVELAGTVAEALPSTSVFPTLQDSSAFFETGALGYSVTSDANRLDGISLSTNEWRVESLGIERVYSSYFADESKFPAGSVQFDHALLMRNIKHEWHSAGEFRV